MDAVTSYAKRAEHAFNGRDTETLSALWAADIAYEGPGRERAVGRAASIARENALWTAFPDLRADLSRHFEASGDRLVIEGVMRGTHDGTLRLGELELAPTGRRVEMSFVAIFEFEGEVACRERVTWDRLSLLQQLGLVPAEDAA